MMVSLKATWILGLILSLFGDSASRSSRVTAMFFNEISKNDSDVVSGCADIGMVGIVIMLFCSFFNRRKQALFLCLRGVECCYSFFSGAESNLGYRTSSLDLMSVGILVHASGSLLLKKEFWTIRPNLIYYLKHKSIDLYLWLL